MSADRILKSAKALVKGSRLAPQRCLWAFSSSVFTLSDGGDQSVEIFIEGTYAEKLGENRGVVDLELALLGDCAGVVTRESEHWEPAYAQEGDRRFDAALWKSVEWVALATDQDSRRYQLGGVLFDGRHAVATDGRRLHLADLGFSSVSRSRRLIVPVRALAVISTLVKLFKPDDFFVRFTDTEIHVFSEFFVFKSRLIEGLFPNWEAVCPDTSSFERVLLGKDLIDVCKSEEKIAALKNKGAKAKDDLHLPKVAIGNFDSLAWQRVNALYLREAIAGTIGKALNVACDVPSGDQGLPIVIKGGDLSAVIQCFNKRDQGPRGSKLDERKLTYNEVLARGSATV